VRCEHYRNQLSGVPGVTCVLLFYWNNKGMRGDEAGINVIIVMGQGEMGEGEGGSKEIS